MGPDARVLLAFRTVYDGHRGGADVRDKIFLLMQDFDGIIQSHGMYIHLLDKAAVCCSSVGPKNEAVRLWKELCERRGGADDSFNLSQAYADIDEFPLARNSLEHAAEIAPEKYGKLLTDLVSKLASESASVKTPKIQKRAIYPTQKAFNGDISKLIKDHIASDLASSLKFIDTSSNIFSAGSCYSRDFIESLSNCGFSTNHVELDERVFTTYGTRALIDWISGALPEDSDMSSIIREIVSADISKQDIRSYFEQCNVFILTLGYAPSFFDKKTGGFVIPASTSIGTKLLANSFDFRTTTVQENVDNILYIISFIREINPSVYIVILVAPNPILMTFESNSAVTADCISKSTLRLAANEIVSNQNLKNVFYWPSLEIFRWVSGHRSPVYGTDDGASWHVSSELIQAEVQCFVDVFSKP